MLVRDLQGFAEFFDTAMLAAQASTQSHKVAKHGEPAVSNAAAHFKCDRIQIYVCLQSTSLAPNLVRLAWRLARWRTQCACL